MLIRCVLLLLLFNSYTYCQDRFEHFGPYGSKVFSNLTDAAKNESIAYKLAISQPLMNPKHWSKFEKLVNLQAIKIENVGIDSIPYSISTFENLQYLQINYPIRFFDPTFAQLRQLKVLKLYNSHLDSIPVELSHLYSLKELQIQSNQSDTLKLQLDYSYLKNLKSIMIYNTVFDSLHPSIGLAPKLEDLMLIKCSLDTLSSNYKKLSQLHSLILDDNTMNHFPVELFGLSQLETLSLKNNNISHLPERIGEMTRLNYLDVTGNPVKPYDVDILKVLLPNCRVIHDPFPDKD